MNRIRIPCVQASGFLPAYQSPGSAGADLRADIQGDLNVEPGRRVAVPTGLRVEIPPGFEAQIRPRSGLALNHGVTVLNAPGTIDSDYRGEIRVILINLGESPFLIHRGDRIAQMVFQPVIRAEFVAQEGIHESARGEGGFGSTGV